MKESYTLYKCNLNQFYRPVFDRIEAYVCTQSVDENTREERLGELLDIFLSAQSSGKPVHKIVGNDIERFCKNFCADFSLKSRIKYIMRPLSLVAWLLAVGSIFDIVLWLLFTAKKTGDYNIFHCINRSSIATFLLPYIPLLIAILITNMILRRLMIKKRHITIKTFTFVYLIEGGILLLILMFARVYEWSIPCPTWIIFACAAIYLAIYYIMKLRKND